MKLLSLFCAVSVIVLSVACEQQTDQKPVETPVVPADAVVADGDAMAPGDAVAAGDAEPAKPEQTPVMACTALINAAKAKDDALFLANATDVTAQAVADPSSKELIYTMLGTATCGDATIEGDKATVAVTVAADKRDIPFVKIGDAWKFDSAEYMNKYPPTPEKGKKGKKAKGGKVKMKG